MALSPNQTVRKISAKISAEEIALAKDYIQNAVHSHCNSNPDKEFSVRTLFGGDNKDWTDTPLQCIYDYHKYVRMSKDPAEDAAKDVGWLLKSVLSIDARNFEYAGKNTGNMYKMKQ